MFQGELANYQSRGTIKALSLAGKVAYYVYELVRGSLMHTNHRFTYVLSSSSDPLTFPPLLSVRSERAGEPTIITS